MSYNLTGTGTLQAQKLVYLEARGDVYDYVWLCLCAGVSVAQHISTGTVEFILIYCRPC